MQKYSIFRKVCTIKRQFQHIRTFSRLNEFTVVKNPPDEQKRYEELYDEVIKIFRDRNIENGKL